MNDVQSDEHESPRQDRLRASADFGNRLSIGLHSKTCAAVVVLAALAATLTITRRSFGQTGPTGDCVHAPIGDWSILFVDAAGAIYFGDATFLPAEPGSRNVVGHIDWYGLDRSENSRELISGDFDPANCIFNFQAIGRTGTYQAALSADGRILCGSYTGNGNDNWWGVRARLSQNNFEKTDWSQGWAAIGSANLRRSTLQDGDDGYYAILEALGSGASNQPSVSAPLSFLGNWTWSGNCPTLLSFSLKWVSSTPATIGPKVRISGPAGAAEIDLLDAGIPTDAFWRTYVIDLTEQRWSVPLGTDWLELLRNVESLEIYPALSGDDGEEVGIDNLRLPRPLQRSEFMEWKASDTGFEPLLGGGLIQYSDTDTPTLIQWEQTGGDIPHAPDGKPAFYMRVPAFQDARNGFHLFLQGLGPNGGNRYLSQYTFIWDLFIPEQLNWLPLFNTDPANPQGSDADFYIAPDGAIGYDTLEYSPAGSVPPDQWHRIALSFDAVAGEVRYTVDGVTVLAGSRPPAQLGRWTLFTDCDDGPDVLLFNEPSGGDYTHEVLWMGFAVIDRALDAEELAAIGGVSSDGVIVPLMPALALPVLSPGQQGQSMIELAVHGRVGQTYRLEFSQNLVNWRTLEDVRFEGSTHTFVEDVSQATRYYRVRNLLRPMP